MEIVKLPLVAAIFVVDARIEVILPVDARNIAELPTAQVDPELLAEEIRWSAIQTHAVPGYQRV
jgi:hypothetical protein